jgi:UDP-N-acetylmuramate--alanine ligase
LLGAQFGSSFREADRVVVTGIYPACEAPRPGVTSQIVVDAIARNGVPDDVRRVEGRDDLLRSLRRQVAPGDLVLGLGAGDVTSVMHDFAHGVRGRAPSGGRR